MLLSILLLGCALSQEVAEIYSNIDSCDVTITGNVTGSSLQVGLLHSGRLLNSYTQTLDSAGTWIFSWNLSNPEKGTYDVCATVLDEGCVSTKRCYSFYYGGEIPIRFDVRDFIADSRGIHMIAYAADPAIVDIYYMLISGNKARYVYVERSVKISGGRLVPTLIEWNWPLLLNAGEEYIGRVRMVEISSGQTRAFMKKFVAIEDAKITETYEDEMGASATVLGVSRVPFKGSLRFVLSNDTMFEVVEKKTPILLDGDDESVEISWNKTLAPGIYNLRVMLLNSSGSPVDMRESVIEVEPIVRRGVNKSSESKSSPTITAVVALIVIISTWTIRRRR